MVKIYSLEAGARVPDDILAIANKEKIATASVEAIGGVEELRLGHFDRAAKKHVEHDFHEFFEVASLLGNITVKDDKPFLHVHGIFGRRDLSVLGGHVMSARVYPLMELVLTPTKNRALRRFDDDLGLNTICKA
jgi:hypothetical protein